MKRVFLFLMILFSLCFAAIAEGNAEEEEWNRVITVAGGRSRAYLLEPFAKENYPSVWVKNVLDDQGNVVTKAHWDPPPITFRYIDLDEALGDSRTMNFLVAAGDWPDMYIGFVGSFGQFMTAETGLALDIDESVWDPAILATFRRDGKLMGLPHTLPVQGMAINTDILERAGFPVPDEDWKMNDLVDMLEAIKQLPDYAGNSADGSGIWPTFLFAKNNTADYFYLNYFSSFGVQLFADNDYTRSAVNDTPGGVEAFRFLKLLVDRGYSPPDSATRGVSELLPGFRDTSIAVTGYRPNWIPPHQAAAIKAGEIEEPFNYVVLPFPTAPGITGPPPIPGIGTGAYGTATDDPVKAAIISALIEHAMGYQEIAATKGDIPTRIDVARSAPDPETGRIFDAVDISGFMDPGYTFEWYMETRAALPPILRELYNGRITPEEAAQKYEDAINAILAEYAE